MIRPILASTPSTNRQVFFLTAWQIKLISNCARFKVRVGRQGEQMLDLCPVTVLVGFVHHLQVSRYVLMSHVNLIYLKLVLDSNQELEGKGLHTSDGVASDSAAGCVCAPTTSGQVCFDELCKSHLSPKFY